jgi:hypothetical protein
MKTAADEHIKSAERCLREAIGHLNEVLLSGCPGHSEYRIEYVAALHDALVCMIRAKQQISLYQE